MTGILWLTNIDTAEPVGVPLSKLLLIEQKRAQDGGAVALYLDHGREVHVSESLPRVNELIEAHFGQTNASGTPAARSGPMPSVLIGADDGTSGPLSLAATG